MKIREFRSYMKLAFDAAEMGEKVEIERDGVVYLLVSADKVKESRKQTPPENKKNNSGASPISSFGTMPEPVNLQEAYNNIYRTEVHHRQLIDNLPASDIGEFTCCSKVAPCKHWEWNSNIKLYVNKLSGREREVEGGDWGA